MLREEAKKVKQNLKAVVEVYNETSEGTPEETVQALVDRLGYEEAREAVAVLVATVGDWDGRVYDYVRTWAASITEHTQRELMDAYIFQPSEIHPAHINQLAQAMKAYEPKTPDPEDFEEVVAEGVCEEVEAAPLWVIEYGAGKPGVKVETFRGEYQQAFQYAADHASGWGFSVVAPVPEETEEEDEEDEETKKAEAILADAVKTIEGRKTRSAWAAGVKAYALELLEEFTADTAAGWYDVTDIFSMKLFEKRLLNEASDWREYSEGGCALVYNQDIAERLCAPWELRKTDNGRKDPNPRENWIDCQSRALWQAWHLINDTIREAHPAIMN